LYLDFLETVLFTHQDFAAEESIPFVVVVDAQFITQVDPAPDLFAAAVAANVYPIGVIVSSA
jgi:hypothetical protein